MKEEEAVIENLLKDAGVSVYYGQTITKNNSIRILL